VVDSARGRRVIRHLDVGEPPTGCTADRVAGIPTTASTTCSGSVRVDEKGASCRVRAGCHGRGRAVGGVGAGGAGHGDGVRRADVLAHRRPERAPGVAREHGVPFGGGGLRPRRGLHAPAAPPARRRRRSRPPPPSTTPSPRISSGTSASSTASSSARPSPWCIAQSGDGTTPILGARGAALGDTALRDLRVEASWAIVQRARACPTRRASACASTSARAIPFGDESGFNSAGSFTFAPMLAADVRLRALHLHRQRRRPPARGAPLRRHDRRQRRRGQRGRRHPPHPPRLTFSFEYFTTVGLASEQGRTSPMTGEVFGGARLATDAAGDVELLAGVGVPVLADPLNPAWRGILGISYAPRGTDRDRDGVIDADDRCIDVAEDRDEFEDEDGCVDPDNDGDSVPDVSDRCPNEPEDADNHEDADGCPDDDNDNDSVSDSRRRVPDGGRGRAPRHGPQRLPHPRHRLGRRARPRRPVRRRRRRRQRRPAARRLPHPRQRRRRRPRRPRRVPQRRPGRPRRPLGAPAAPTPTPTATG
jgi:hypothetical protein